MLSSKIKAGHSVNVAILFLLKHC